ncbi:hypothetical protein EYF80_001829 [Liparis tanakae]|uniref:Uncharacterized protein n=1 Tax=Liparis tanakae TaxID=230148 RepID=A0A4Z2JC22_9TELE|nr:hypothetical protein EYF80_001829 [Liparis tanakae]
MKPVKHKLLTRAALDGVDERRGRAARGQPAASRQREGEGPEAADGEREGQPDRSTGLTAGRRGQPSAREAWREKEQRQITPLSQSKRIVPPPRGVTTSCGQRGAEGPQRPPSGPQEHVLAPPRVDGWITALDIWKVKEKRFSNSPMMNPSIVGGDLWLPERKTERGSVPDAAQTLTFVSLTLFPLWPRPARRSGRREEGRGPRHGYVSIPRSWLRSCRTPESSSRNTPTAPMPARRSLIAM